MPKHQTRTRKLEGLTPSRKSELVEGRDYVTALYDAAGVRLTTIPLPHKGADVSAPWGRDPAGRVIAPFGLAKTGKPRRRMPGGPAGGMSQYHTPMTRAIEQRLADLNCDPIAILAEIALDRKNDAFVRVKA